MNKGADVVTQSTVAEHNRSDVLHFLYSHGVSSRAAIAKQLGLTPAAITKITTKLIEVHALKETGGMRGDKNRRSIGLMLDAEQFHVIGVKFARSLVQIGVFDLQGKKISLIDMPQVSEENISRTVHLIHERVGELISQDKTIIAIGMAVPGPYLREVGRTVVVSSMQGWRNINFRREFEQAFTVPVFIEQDARAGALAEYLFGQTQHNNSLAYYLLGEGIGLGVIEQGRLINGALGAATEIGHVSIDVHGKPCECGNVGCLERYCSAVAIHNMILEQNIIPIDAEASHAQACYALFKAADQGNQQAQQLIEEIGTYVGYGCVTIFNAFNPAKIVIGDIVSAGSQRLLRAIRDVVDSRAIPELNDSTTIELSALPTDATVAGAAAVAITQFLNNPSLFFDLS